MQRLVVRIGEPLADILTNKILDNKFSRSIFQFAMEVIFLFILLLQRVLGGLSKIVSAIFENIRSATKTLSVKLGINDAINAIFDAVADLSRNLKAAVFPSKASSERQLSENIYRQLHPSQNFLHKVITSMELFAKRLLDSPLFDSSGTLSMLSTDGKLLHKGSINEFVRSITDLKSRVGVCATLACPLPDDPLKAVKIDNNARARDMFNDLVNARLNVDRALFNRVAKELNEIKANPTAEMAGINQKLRDPGISESEKLGLIKELESLRIDRLMESDSMKGIIGSTPAEISAFKYGTEYNLWKAGISPSGTEAASNVRTIDDLLTDGLLDGEKLVNAINLKYYDDYMLFVNRYGLLQPKDGGRIIRIDDDYLKTELKYNGDQIKMIRETMRNFEINWIGMPAASDTNRLHSLLNHPNVRPWDDTAATNMERAGITWLPSHVDSSTAGQLNRLSETFGEMMEMAYQRTFAPKRAADALLDPSQRDVQLLGELVNNNYHRVLFKDPGAPAAPGAPPNAQSAYPFDTPPINEYLTFADRSISMVELHAMRSSFERLEIILTKYLQKDKHLFVIRHHNTGYDSQYILRGNPFKSIDLPDDDPIRVLANLMDKKFSKNYFTEFKVRLSGDLYLGDAISAKQGGVVVKLETQGGVEVELTYGTGLSAIENLAPSLRNIIHSLQVSLQSLKPKSTGNEIDRVIHPVISTTKTDPNVFELMFKRNELTYHGAYIEVNGLRYYDDVTHPLSVMKRSEDLLDQSIIPDDVFTDKLKVEMLDGLVRKSSDGEFTSWDAVPSDRAAEILSEMRNLLYHIFKGHETMAYRSIIEQIATTGHIPNKYLYYLLLGEDIPFDVLIGLRHGVTGRSVNGQHVGYRISYSMNDGEISYLPDGVKIRIPIDTDSYFMLDNQLTAFKQIDGQPNLWIQGPTEIYRGNQLVNLSIEDNLRFYENSGIIRYFEASNLDDQLARQILPDLQFHLKMEYQRAGTSKFDSDIIAESRFVQDNYPNIELDSSINFVEPNMFTISSLGSKDRVFFRFTSDVNNLLLDGKLSAQELHLINAGYINLLTRTISGDMFAGKKLVILSGEATPHHFFKLEKDVFQKMLGGTLSDRWTVDLLTSSIQRLKASTDSISTDIYHRNISIKLSDAQYNLRSAATSGRLTMAKPSDIALILDDSKTLKMFLSSGDPSFAVNTGGTNQVIALLDEISAKAIGIQSVQSLSASGVSPSLARVLPTISALRHSESLEDLVDWLITGPTQVGPRTEMIRYDPDNETAVLAGIFDLIYDSTVDQENLREHIKNLILNSPQFPFLNHMLQVNEDLAIDTYISRRLMGGYSPLDELLNLHKRNNILQGVFRPAVNSLERNLGQYDYQVTDEDIRTHDLEIYMFALTGQAIGMEIGHHNNIYNNIPIYEPYVMYNRLPNQDYFSEYILSSYPYQSLFIPAVSVDNYSPGSLDSLLFTSSKIELIEKEETFEIPPEIDAGASIDYYYENRTQTNRFLDTGEVQFAHLGYNAYNILSDRLALPDTHQLYVNSTMLDIVVQYIMMNQVLYYISSLHPLIEGYGHEPLDTYLARMFDIDDRSMTEKGITELMLWSSFIYDYFGKARSYEFLPKLSADQLLNARFALKVHGSAKFGNLFADMLFGRTDASIFVPSDFIIGVNTGHRILKAENDRYTAEMLRYTLAESNVKFIESSAIDNFRGYWSDIMQRDTSGLSDLFSPLMVADLADEYIPFNTVYDPTHPVRWVYYSQDIDLAYVWQYGLLIPIIRREQQFSVDPFGVLSNDPVKDYFGVLSDMLKWFHDGRYRMWQQTTLILRYTTARLVSFLNYVAGL
jgi:hypothetical protein